MATAERMCGCEGALHASANSVGRCRALRRLTRRGLSAHSIAVLGTMWIGGPVLASGHDLIAGAVNQIQKWGTVDDITAYSIGVTLCNVGSEPLAWVHDSSDHPITSQGMYRYHDGRFEMIGMSWLFHGYCALQQSLCGPCTPPGGGGCLALLGVGCSDVNSASINGQQSNLGPRSIVNASTGEFPVPFIVGPAPAPTIGRRLQVSNSDLDPSLNAGALYFAEAMHIHPQDALSGNGNNNASYRPLNIGSFASGGWSLTFAGPTVQQLPAIYAWSALDPQVEIAVADVAPNGAADGRFILGSRAYANRDGTWTYEYALNNLNSHRSARSFAIALPQETTVTGVGAHFIPHHSGEPYDTDPWTVDVDTDGGSGTVITWSTAAFDENPNANALRWHTMFNFRFTSQLEPTCGHATVGLFRPGTPDAIAINAIVPSGGGAPVGGCARFPIGDLNGDGVVDGADLGLLLSNWGKAGTGDLNGDAVVDGADLGILLANWTGS